MRSWSKRLLLASTVAAACLIVEARPAEAILGMADTVFCVNCSDILTQAAQLGKEAASLESQLQSHITQLSQYANQIQNTIALPTQVWGQVQNDMMQIRSIANAGSVLSGNAGSLVSRLQSAGGYANMAASFPTNMQSQFSTWQQTLGNNLNTFGRTLGLQDTQQSNDAALIAAIQRHSQTAQGQMQALQASNELAAQTAQQLMQIRQTIAANGQVQANWIAVQADRQAVGDAALQQFLATPALPTSGGRSW